MCMIPSKEDCEAEEGEARTPVPGLEDAAGVWICAACPSSAVLRLGLLILYLKVNY